MRGERSNRAGTRARAAATRAADGATTATAVGRTDHSTALGTTEGAAAAAAGHADRATSYAAADDNATAPGTRGTDRTAETREAAYHDAAVAPRGAARATALDAATRACFLDQLALLGCPARAAAAVGIAPVSAYALRRRSARFAAAWRDALAIGYERLEAEALRQLLEHETPLDLAAALALLDRHRAAAGDAAPVTPPRAPRRQRHALGPAGAELARRLQLYAGASPRVRRTPVSPAAAAEVDAIERAAAADWGEVDEAVPSGGAPAGGAGPGTADTDAGAGIAEGVNGDTADAGGGFDVGAATAIDSVAAAPTGAGSQPDSSGSRAKTGEGAARAPHVAVLLDPGVAPSREHEASDVRGGHVREGPSNAGSPAPASATTPRSPADAVRPAWSSAPEQAEERSRLKAPDGANAAVAPAASPRVASTAPPDAAHHAGRDTPPAPFAARAGARRSVCPAEAPPGNGPGAPPPGVASAPRPRIWA